MASRSSRLTVFALVAAVAAAGYFVHGLFAAQGQGVLAQAPLNTQVQVPPAFVMALDDSGSMRFQTLFPGRDGTALWGRDSSSQPYSFFYSSGTNAGKLRGTGTNSTDRQYVHVAPYPAPRQANPGNDNAAIPPIDAFGFSRSHVYNGAYFNPGIDYEPWLKADGTPWDDADPEAVRVDPNNATPTFDITVERRSTSSNNASHHGFRVREGMVMPSGMKYYDSSTARNSCGLTRGRSSSSGQDDWRVLTEDVTVTCNADLYIAYYPATFYLPTSHPAPEGFITNKRVLAPNACSYPTATGDAACNMYRYEIREENYSTTEAYEEAIVNFANWFSYYGARNRSMVAAVTHSLAAVENMRVGYFTINNRVNAVMRDMGVPTEKGQFYSSVFGLGASGNTPNLPAVEYLGQQFRRTDANAPIQRACQKNAGMLFTDGLSNVAASTTVGNVDKNMGPPFADNHSNTIADIATRFYLDSANQQGGLAPLRSGTGFAAGQVPVPEACKTATVGSLEWKRLDCQPNLHMNFYGITLGARGEIFDPDNPRDPFVAPHPDWPPYEEARPSTVDDIWHATVNTRGEFINATTPADITAAMRRVLASVSAGESPSGSLALTGARIGAGSLTVVPDYEVRNNGTDWYSHLVASSVKVNAIGAVEMTEEWRAEREFPGPASRQVYFTSGGTTKRFNATNLTLANLCSTPGNLYPGMSRCSAADISALGVDITGAVNYLLGDASGEKKNGGALRDRTTILGDIVNSTPVVSAPIDDYGYGTLPGGLGTSYRTYLGTKRSSQRYMVYVGANDGMLHAFDGGMAADGSMDSLGGEEVFAYVPATAVGHMGNLLFPYDPGNDNDQKFAHRYFVDGPVTVSDAHYKSNWSTVVVGTSGAGGRSVFALDVKSPTSFDGSKKLWEISDLDTTLDANVRANIGHVLGKPVVVPVKTTNGNVRWVALFGNGYKSASGKAVLFVVDIDTGSPSIRMVEATASGTVAGENGLGNIVAVDRWGGNDLTSAGRDGFVDTVYGADQKGNLWKFDLRAAAPANVTVPVFQTATHTETEGGVTSTYRQPILGGLTAATGPNGGVMVYFGTGSFSFVGDPDDTKVQTLYAVNDTVRGAVTTTLGRANLHPWSMTTVAGSRRLTAGTPPLNARGWYVDLPAGERFVGNPRIATGTIFWPTYAPDASSGGCSTSGFNWLFGLNARTGAPNLSNVRFGSINGTSPAAGTAAVALETGGTAPVRDVGVMAIPRLEPPGLPTGGGGPGAPPAPPEQGCWMMVTVAGAQQMYLPYPCGRQSWRQLQ